MLTKFGESLTKYLVAFFMNFCALYIMDLYIIHIKINQMKVYTSPAASMLGEPTSGIGDCFLLRKRSTPPAIKAKTRMIPTTIPATAPTLIPSLGFVSRH